MSDMSKPPTKAPPTQEQFDALRDFARWCLTGGGGDWCNDIDGYDIQDKAHSLGILNEVLQTIPCEENACLCADVYDTGDEVTCYRVAEWMK